MIEQFREVARLLADVGPRLDQAERAGPDAVMIETQPLIDRSGKMHARIWGPFTNEDEAHIYINIKRDRHRLANAKHFGEGGTGTIENDKHIFGHPNLQYRVVSSAGYFAKYLAQIMVTCAGGMVGAATKGEVDLPFLPPSEDFGLEDSEDALA